jgi:hypothetical protein
MPLILDPERHSVETLSALVRDFATELAEWKQTLEAPTHRVIDPASLVTARDLVDATLTALATTGSESRAELAAKANLGSATLLAAIDLYKSHTDAPRTPRRSKPASSPA